MCTIFKISHFNSQKNVTTFKLIFSGEVMKRATTKLMYAYNKLCWRFYCFSNVQIAKQTRMSNILLFTTKCLEILQKRYISHHNALNVIIISQHVHTNTPYLMFLFTPYKNNINTLRVWPFVRKYRTNIHSPKYVRSAVMSFLDICIYILEVSLIKCLQSRSFDKMILPW